MSYQETLDYLYSRLPMFQRTGPAAYKPSLDNTISLLKEVNDPQHGFRSVHIAGTNGKGSVSHMLAAVLQAQGFKTGLYTSPHLLDFRERIRINGEMISREEVMAFTERMKSISESIAPSFFEMTVAMAFDHFKRNQVDIAVIETGLGGRLDSTNVITPELAVITNIGLDHTNLLGNTLSAIAREKAGIIKPNIPVVIGEYQPETFPVFLSKARAEEAAVFLAASKWKVSFADAPDVAGKRKFKAERRSGKLELISGLGGDYQLCNLATVMESVARLNESGIKISDDALAAGLEMVKEYTGLRGRWEIISTSPLIIFDTGHNEAGIKYVVNQLSALKYSKLHFILGVVNDKDPSSVLKLLPKEAAYYFCQPAIPRAMPVEQLAQIAGEIGLQGTSYPGVAEAFSAARSTAVVDDLIFAGGSTFVVADALAALEG